MLGRHCCIRLYQLHKEIGTVFFLILPGKVISVLFFIVFFSFIHILQLLEFWEGDMVLSVAKFVPAGLHVCQTLNGKINIKTQQLILYICIFCGAHMIFYSWPVPPYLLLFLAPKQKF